MRKVTKKIFGLFVALLLFAHAGAAQKGEKLEKKWLAEDVEVLKLIPKILPLESQTKETLVKIFRWEGFEREEEFGARSFGNAASRGYTSLSVSVYTFRGSILSYKISSHSSPRSWLLIKPYMIEGWKRHAQIPFQETDRGIFYEHVDEKVLQEYKDSINEKIGAMKPAEVPAELKNEYEYLTAPFNDIQVSNDLCGYAPIKVEGRKMIELFINGGRVDLIENILKGFNHGGRVYAAIALLEMKKSGIKLSDETERTMEKVVNLNLSVMTCSGCFMYPMSARALLQEYNLL